MLFIFEVHVRPGHSPERYAQAWVKASRLIQQATGARGTRLHRKIGEPRTLLAIASWESKTSRDAMEANGDPRVEEIIRSQAEFVDVRVVGEFEDAEWEVLPGAED